MEALLQHTDVEHAQEHVDALKESYEALVAAAQQEAPQEAAVAVEAGAEEHTAAPELPAQPIESAPLLDEEDKKFKQMLDAFNTKVNDIRRLRQKPALTLPCGGSMA